MVKFGMFPPMATRRGGLAQLVQELWAEAKLAEACGFDCCLVGEHHQQLSDYFATPLVVAAALAAQTKQLKVGTGILLLPLHYPIEVAEQAAMVDIVSQGRLILGVGIGYQEVDYQAFGIPMGERISRFEEGVEIIRRCWTEERFSFHGRRFYLEDVTITPKPLQKPHPPLWLGAWSEGGVRRAARLGDAWISDPVQNLPAMARLAKVYWAECQRLGKAGQIVLMRDAWIAESRERAAEEFWPVVAKAHRYYWKRRAFQGAYEPWVDEIQSEDEVTLERVSLDRFILGSPEECVEQIEAWREATGAEYFVLSLRQPSGPSHERTMEVIRAFGEKVIPRFQ